MKTYQEFISERKGSPGTSRKQVAAAFKKIDWTGVRVNFDYGGGKFNEATQWLKKHHDVTNFIYDSYNRSSSHNREAWINGDIAETSTLFNVLNVIPTKDERIKVLKQLKRKNTQRIYISVYEKAKTGKGEETRVGWQTNMHLNEYLPEVQEVYSSAYIKKKMIIINV